MPRHAPAIELTAEQRSELQRLVRASGSSQQAVRRARIVLLAAQGQPNDEIAATLETSPPSVSKWRQRFARQGLGGLDDAPRSGRPIRLSADQLNVVLTPVTQPPEGPGNERPAQLPELPLESSIDQGMSCTKPLR